MNRSPHPPFLILRFPILVLVGCFLALPELSAAEASALRGSSLYAVVPGPSWSEARSNALKLGGDLVTINDLPEWDAFKAHFAPANGYAYPESFSLYPAGEVQLWVGLNDIDTEGTYTWISGQISSVPLEQLFRPPGTPSEDDCGVWQWEQGKITAYTDNVANTGWPEFAKAMRGVAEVPCGRRGNSIYVVVRGPSWELAQAAAQNLGGHLATIEDADENEFVRAIIDASPLKAESESGAWIGLNDVASEADWVWVSGSSAPFRNWQPGEPNGNNEVYTDSDYVHMYYNGLWNDHKSDGTITIGVAEIPLNALRFFDSDGDGVNDYREEKDGTDSDDPTSFNPLSKGLVAYYPLSTNVDDQSGYGHHGTLRGLTETVANRFGKSAAALSFIDTAPGWQVSGSGINLSGSSFTIAFWYSKLISPFTNWIFWIGSEGGSGKTINLALEYGADVRFSFFYNDLDHSFPQGQDANTWYHVVGTYDAASGLRKLFVDGTEVASDSPPTGFSGNDIFQFGVRGSAMNDVRIYSRTLSPAEVARLYYSEALSEAQRQFLASNPSVQGHFGQAEYNANRINGQTDVTTNPAAFNLFTQSQYENFGALHFSNGVSSVTTNPSAFNLFTQEQFDNNRTAGQSDVINNPMSYGLYTSNSIMDLRMGGLMIQRQGTDAVVSFQTQTTTDLTLPFTNNGTPITNTIPMPGNKGFIRINAKPIATPIPPQ